MMKKIFFLAFGLFMTMTSLGQTSSDSLQSINDSVVTDDSYSRCSTAALEDGITKAVGDSAYLKNDYASAVHIYETLLKNGEATEVYYNLGNSYYKSGDIAKAILNYERALLLQPGNVDVRANLEIARAKTIDKVVPVAEVFFISWTKSLINCLSVDAWGYVGIVCFFLLLPSLYFFLFAKQIVCKKVGFTVGIVFLIVVVFANIFAFQQKGKLLNRNNAIVLTPSVTVRSTPSDSGTSLFILHEGRKVEIKDSTMREWREIRLEDGKVGWVPASSVEII